MLPDLNAPFDLQKEKPILITKDVAEIQVLSSGKKHKCVTQST